MPRSWWRPDQWWAEQLTLAQIAWAGWAWQKYVVSGRRFAVRMRDAAE